MTSVYRTLGEVVCFVIPRLAMFPEVEPRKTSLVERSQNILLSKGSI